MSGYLRYVKDFISWELRRIRPGWTIPYWDENGELTRAPLFLDSLELVVLAGLLADRFHVRSTGAEDYFLARRTLKEWADLLKYTREQNVADVSFATSGSTGTPRLHTHTWENLLREAAFFADVIGPRSRVIKTIPSHHIYGFLFTWLVPELMNIEVVEQSPEVPQWQTGDLVVTVPFMLDLWLKRKIPIPTDVTFILSTAPLPGNLAQSLLEAGSRYYEIYGSTETSGIGWRAHPSHPFRLLPWWEVVIESPEKSPILKQGEKLYNFPDEVDIPTPGWVVPKKRLDGAIQIGGVNVYPSRVKSVLEQSPLVDQASVRPFQEGASIRLKAFIVPSQLSINQKNFEMELRDWVSQHLTPPERPVSYTFGDTLPRSPMGKDADW